MTGIASVVADHAFRFPCICHINKTRERLADVRRLHQSTDVRYVLNANTARNSELSAYNNYMQMEIVMCKNAALYDNIRLTVQCIQVKAKFHYAS